MNKFWTSIAGFAVVLLVGCGKDIDLEDLEKKTPEEIYTIGQKEMNERHYGAAVKVFDGLERLHPYSKLVANAQLRAGECNYNSKKYSEASSSFEIFVKTHPIHEQVPYAIYMLGLINYEQMPIVERDQDATVESLQYLEELCDRYPDCKYIKDAKEKIVKLREQLAGREVYVARYYQGKENYAAAINRLNVVIEQYSDTIHAPEALHRLIECYVAMGEIEEALLVFGVLKNNHPKSIWTGHASAILQKK
ncbi:MAG: outer membrane protein assembly factor BamD [Holosporales bacterium]|jgi:outer membrane protein assembly factor BamD|nr:outer membrane protein assembly factor BamD [Holosporales bacterium]